LNCVYVALETKQVGDNWHLIVDQTDWRNCIATQMSQCGEVKFNANLQDMIGQSSHVDQGIYLDLV
jgi:hypothetical protein